MSHTFNMPGAPDASPRTRFGSIRVARILGIDIVLHWSFPLLVALVVWSYWNEGRQAVLSALLWVAAVFASVVVHELAHCLVARRRGAVVVDILLTPIGGMSQLSKIPESPSDELAISIVGPLTSFGLALLTAAAGLYASARLWPPSLFAGSWFSRLLWLNLLLGAFNMLPALPMDGGRVLRALLARRYDRGTATHIAASIARFIAALMLLAGFFYDFWLILIAIFLFLTVSAEENAANDRSGHGGGTAESSELSRKHPGPRGEAGD